MRTTSRTMGDYYTCDCRVGFDDDPENEIPDCLVDVNAQIEVRTLRNETSLTYT